MNRNGKIIALTAVLALCLLLTGCYVPPDDVNNDGNQTVNKPSFEVITAVPVATTAAPAGIAPDETQATANPGAAQNTIAGQTGATPAGNSGSPDWSNWGNTPIPMGVSINLGGQDGGASPEPGSTIGLVTSSVSPSMSPSVTPTVSPSPTPPSLQRGFKGSEAVRSLQKRLKELGYYSGSVDGDFGEGTEKAVKEFQKAHIPTVVWMTPILPFLTDTEENMRRILDYCFDADVKGIVCFSADDLGAWNQFFWSGSRFGEYPGFTPDYVHHLKDDGRVAVENLL